MATDPIPIDVGAALIFRAGRLLITQRPKGGHLGGLWEFPGGKREPGETWEACVIREIQEELGVVITIGARFAEVTHVYPERAVHLQFFTATFAQGEPRPIGCSACAWITREQLDDFAFPAADAQLLAQLKNPHCEVWV
jgi:mutator protein MutT